MFVASRERQCTGFVLGQDVCSVLPSPSWCPSGCGARLHSPHSLGLLDSRTSEPADQARGPNRGWGRTGAAGGQHRVRVRLHGGASSQHPVQVGVRPGQYTAVAVTAVTWGLLLGGRLREGAPARSSPGRVLRVSHSPDTD